MAAGDRTAFPAPQLPGEASWQVGGRGTEELCTLPQWGDLSLRFSEEGNFPTLEAWARRKGREAGLANMVR